MSLNNNFNFKEIPFRNKYLHPLCSLKIIIKNPNYYNQLIKQCRWIKNKLMKFNLPYQLIPEIKKCQRKHLKCPQVTKLAFPTIKWHKANFQNIFNSKQILRQNKIIRWLNKMHSRAKEVMQNPLSK